MNYRQTKRACYIGYFVQAIVNNFLPLIFVILQNTYDISYEALGRLVLISFCTQLCTDAASIKLTQKIGYRKAVLCSHILASAGMASLGFLPCIMPPYIGLAVSVVIYSVGSGMIEVLISPIIEFLPTEDKSGNMSLLHSFYGWGSATTILISTLLIRFWGGESWKWISLLWAIIPAINFFNFINTPIVEPKSENDGSDIKLSNLGFLLCMLLMCSAGASEIAISDWASTFAENGLGVSKTLGDLLGPCFFAICMALGRMIFASFGDKIRTKYVLTFCSGMCFLMYMLIVFAPNEFISLIGAALCGMFISVMWPGVFSFSAQRFKNGGTKLFGLLALAGDLGCSLGPWVVGFFADKYNLSVGFEAASVFPLLMFITLIFFKEEEK